MLPSTFLTVSTHWLSDLSWLKCLLTLPPCFPCFAYGIATACSGLLLMMWLVSYQTGFPPAKHYALAGRTRNYRNEVYFVPAEQLFQGRFQDFCSKKSHGTCRHGFWGILMSIPMLSRPIPRPAPTEPSRSSPESPSGSHLWQRN